MEDEKSFQREVLDRLITIENKLSDLPEIKKVTYDNQKDIIKLQEKDEQQQRTIDGLLDDQKFTRRTSIGAAITAAIGILAAYIKFGLGM